MLENYFLLYDKQKLICKSKSNSNFKLYIDFLNPTLQWRLNTLNKQQIFSKSLGLHKKIKNPYIIDATAGLGNDALSMLKLGCRVKMIESSRLIYLLLKDALLRANTNLLSNRLNINHLSLINDDSIHFLTTLNNAQQPDIIYLDPMFPQRTKSAKIKQTMHRLQNLAVFTNTQKLLEIALIKTKHRVVVKRSRHAPYLNQEKPTLTYSGKSIRYDVYCV